MNLVLTSEKALHTHPFNDLAVRLEAGALEKDKPFRLFSITQPFYEHDVLSNEHAVTILVHALRTADVLSPVVRHIVSKVRHLADRGVVLPSAIQLAGLSFGALLSIHALAHLPAVTSVIFLHLSSFWPTWPSLSLPVILMQPLYLGRNASCSACIH